MTGRGRKAPAYPIAEGVLYENAFANAPAGGADIDRPLELTFPVD